MAPADNAALPARMRRAFAFPIFLAALLVAGVFVNLAARLSHTAGLPSGHWHATFVEGDTYWHIAVGRSILGTHHWPTTNFYSFTTPNSEWLAYEWLGEVLIALAARSGGPSGLMALLVVLVSSLVLLVYYYAGIRSHNPKSAFLACAAVWPMLSISFTVRPQLLGYIALLVTLISLERFRQGLKKRLWFLPILFVLWVNTHGTFVFGLAAMAIYWVTGLTDFRLAKLEGKAWLPHEPRHLGWVILLCAAALFANPYGPHLLRYELSIAAQPVNLKYFEEWQPLAFHDFTGVWFLILIFSFGVGLTGLPRVRERNTVMMVLFVAWLACVHQRFLILFGIVVAPALADILATWIPPYEAKKDRPVLNAALMAVFVLAGVTFFPSPASLQRQIDLNFPRRAVDYLRAHPVPGPMFNEDFWGGYLIWAFDGQRKVFIDGRSDAYEPSGVLADYVRIIQPAPEALSLLDKYGVCSCLVERAGSLCALLDAQPGWRRVYQDNLSVLFVRARRSSE